MKYRTKSIADKIERFRFMLDYDPESGDLRWKNAPQGKPHFVGCRIGTVSRGYLIFKLDQEMQQVHRVVWAMHYGEEPPLEIDHIDGDKGNNAINNLRDGTKGINTMNRAMHRDGLVGVKHYKGRWHARGGKAGAFLYYGKDFFEACAARKSWENQYRRAA
jgi:hypothetical protein